MLTAAPTGAINYNGTSGSYVIRSYRQSHDGSNKQPVAWEVTGYEYSDDDGVTWTSGQPAWLTALSLTSGEGGTAQQTGTATVTTSYTDLSAARNASLSGATAKSSYDLSEGGETANCYVISAPGTYKIPLIYGNMRSSDGTLNTSALQATFTDGAGRSLYTQATQPSSILPLIEGVSGSTGADLVWSDAGNGIVTNLAIDLTNHFLTFEVPQVTIRQGNAVVGIYNTVGDVKTYLWSWHLWFAPESALDPVAVTNNTNETCNFTTEPLGWVYDNGNITTYSLPRKARVTVRQTVGSDPQTATFIITQDNSVGSGHCTLYQFGRKDAFPGTDSNLSGSFSTAGQGRVDYATAISHPGTFYRYDSTVDNYDWNDVHPTNAWSANESGWDANNPVVKTVYDPCPVGFHMPQRNAFRGFTSTGGNTSDAAQFNVSGSFVRGWNFWTNNTHAATIFFPGCTPGTGLVVLLGAVPVCDYPVHSLKGAIFAAGNYFF